MSNALPGALLRPSCAALRSSAPIATQWHTLTTAFARNFCSPSQTQCRSSTSRSSLVSILQSRSLNANTLRSFTTSHRHCAKVRGVPEKKRTVKIGPLPDGEVSAKTIRQLFGAKVSQEDGNNVLRILHHRRVYGSLADYGVDHLSVKKFKHITRHGSIQGLEWLRERYPVDEARAAEEWAEKEANRISYELWVNDPENESKWRETGDAERAYQDEQREIEEIQHQDEAETRKIGMLHAGKSQLELNIERKRKERLDAVTKKAEEKEAREQEEEEKIASGEWVRSPGGTQLMKPWQTTYVDIFGKEQIDNTKEIREKYQKKAQSPFSSEEEMLKASTTWERLYPMTALVIVTCALCYGFAHFYSPPSPEYRIWPDLSPTTATLVALFAINGLVCLAWRHKPLWPLLTRYFMNVPGYPSPFAALLNPFSHIKMDHLVPNMMWLGLIGTACHELVGRGDFLGTYIASGAVGSLASLYYANLIGPINVHALGASAAIAGVTALYLLLSEEDKLKIPVLKDAYMNFYPKAMLVALVALDVIGLARKRTGMDHMSHLGGYVTGATVAGYMKYQGFDGKRVWDGVRKPDESPKIQGVGGDGKVVDPIAMVKSEAEDVKEAVVGAVKK